MNRRRPPGRGSQLSERERTEILKLVVVDGCSMSEAAKRTGRDRGTIATVVKTSDTKALREGLLTDRREQVLELLKANGVEVVRAWLHAIGVASNRGDHRAALAWLLHGNLVDPVVEDAPSTRVSIQIGTPEHPMRIPSPLRMLEREREDEDGST